jgi:CYTH domain-containing protein
MDKTARTEYQRVFIVDRLPEPLTASSAHLQIFDTYLPNTRLRVRQARDPHTNTWVRLLQQRYSVGEGQDQVTKFAEIHLDDEEFLLFERMRGAESRKNRYFHEFGGRSIAFDIYLGDLRGLALARVEFETQADLLEYEPEAFMLYEVTANEAFDSMRLAESDFADLAHRIRELAARVPPRIAED